MSSDIVAALRDWIWIVGAISPFMVGGALLYLRSQFPTKAEHAETAAGLRASMADLAHQVEQRRTDHEGRINRLEIASEGLPDRTDLDELGRRLASVERATGVTAEAVRGTERLLARVDHTLNLLLQNKLTEERRS
ncbi:DUF2730 family protein [Segnochrobactrum spirostomi]|uniref:DUF2730 family protein n=1 Tax=Segnochrobactrum spirostomi TaxID=2608987 RepID=A0A6A7Y9S7_9HYPH|nr:DUF2730 family protein [Segnochrobactrum spirostomi]MQT14402.1 DUF2730 family protein [Segnochrobactrum spirostomi]